MILVNTDYISGKQFEMLGLVKGSTIQSKQVNIQIKIRPISRADKFAYCGL